MEGTTIKVESAKEIVDKDKTFNKLKEIQSLLKKESSLNELCNKIINYNIKNFITSCSC